jgi:two-component system NtrC family sensor kinase
MSNQPRTDSSDASQPVAGQGKKQSAQDRLKFCHLGESIVQSLPIGVVAFDTELKIIQANGHVAELIELDTSRYIDKSLARGTDPHVWQNWTAQLKSVISSDTVHCFDSVEYERNGNKRLLHITCTPLREADSRKSLGGIIIFEDVTERVNIKKQLAKAERLATVGKLASRVAHELNNPMDGILRYLNLALRILQQKKLEKPIGYLQQCRKGLMRMVQIISELLEFSRGSYAAFEYMQVDKIIEDALRTMDSRITSADIQVLRHYAAGVPRIRSGNLFQVFCNLIKNAVDAMPSGGQLSVTTRLIEPSALIIEFRDTGPGFPPENTEAIFEPFFTTKERGKGTGLGLAISKDIVEKYNGLITAQNHPEGGSVFTVRLPLEGEDTREKDYVPEVAHYEKT